MVLTDAATVRLMAQLRSATDTYLEGLSTRERQDFETCECQLCQGMRELRTSVEQYERGELK